MKHDNSGTGDNVNPIPDGGQAFPLYYGHGADNGMSLRDWFAGMAMQALIINDPDDERTNAIRAYRHADAMLEVREQ